MPLKNSSNKGTKEVTPPSAARHSKSKPKGKFSRLLNHYSPSPENITTRRRPKFIPDSPPRAAFRSLRRTKEKPTCLLFGPHRETLYHGFFFCSNCKLYEDAISSGGFSKKLNRESRRFRCQAKHTDLMFPTDRLVDDDNWKSSSRPINATNERLPSIHSVEDPSNDNSFPDDSVDESEDVSVQSHDPDMFEDVMAYVGVLRMCESVFQEKIKEKDELLGLLESKVLKLNQVIEKQSKTIRRLRNHLNYYKSKSTAEAEKRR